MSCLVRSQPMHGYTEHATNRNQFHKHEESNRFAKEIIYEVFNGLTQAHYRKKSRREKDVTNI